jgi:hypothetical protein
VGMTDWIIVGEADDKILIRVVERQVLLNCEYIIILVLIYNLHLLSIL